MSASDCDILMDLPEGEYLDRGVECIRTRTIRAGSSLEVEAYPVVKLDNKAREEIQRRKSSAAQLQVNYRNSRKKLYRILEANFTNADLVCHPTYDYPFIEHDVEKYELAIQQYETAGVPMDDDQARGHFRNFIAKLRRRVKKRGGDPKQLKYVVVMETTHDPRDEDINSLPAHYHFHAVISSLGILTMDDINECWGKGYTKAQRLDTRNGLWPLAKYMTKQHKKPNGSKWDRRWSHSANCVKPNIRVSDRKISRRRAALVARDVNANGKEILEKIYPGYRLEEAEVRFSDFMPGAWIYARMRRIEPYAGKVSGIPHRAAPAAEPAARNKGRVPDAAKPHSALGGRGDADNGELRQQHARPRRGSGQKGGTGGEDN